MKDDSFQIALLRLQSDLHTKLRDMHDVRKVLIYGLKMTAALLRADEAVAATLDTTDDSVKTLFSIPKHTGILDELLSQFLKDQRPETDYYTLLVPVRRKARSWVVLALRRGAEPFRREEYNALFSVAQIITDVIYRLDRERFIRVRRKIERRIANREDPKDLMYNILHGLHSLTQYDHSASLYITKANSDKLELVAERIAWTKAKSRHIGRRVRIDEDEELRLRRSGVSVYRKDGSVWYSLLEQTNTKAELPRLLANEFNTDKEMAEEVVMLCAPIQTPDGTLSILKISARRPNVLGAYEAELVDSFMPLVSLVVQFSGQIESLRAQVLKAERKHVLADMARATAHDVNHALGTILPRVQVLRGELQEGALDTSTLEEDLHDIEVSVQTCRRIFDGMLAIARETNRGLGHGNVIRAIEQSLSVLQDRLKRKQIEVAMDSPVELPTVRGRQGDITRLFLNLCGNAIDAMDGGGRLIISVETTESTLKVVLQDDGCGIPEAIMHKVMEPFFSNKENGSGLGLAICRSIIREVGGEMTIESTEGEGTQVLLTLPYLDEPILEIR